MTKLGCIKDKFDERDYLMKQYLPVAKMPFKVDYTVKMSPVRNQGNEGTCVAFASGTGMKEYQELIDYEKLILLSVRFVYSECKKIDGFPDAEGTTIRCAMKVLNDNGICRENLWPYKPQQAGRPKKGAVSDAKKFRISAYARILNLNELRLTLVAKGPCVIGIEVFNGIMDTNTGIVPMPKKNEISLGGLAVGFLLSIIRGFDISPFSYNFKPALNSLAGIIVGGGIIWLTGFLFDLFLKKVKW